MDRFSLAMLCKTGLKETRKDMKLSAQINQVQDRPSSHVGPSWATQGKEEVVSE